VKAQRREKIHFYNYPLLSAQKVKQPKELMNDLFANIIKSTK